MYAVRKMKLSFNTCFSILSHFKNNVLNTPTVMNRFCRNSELLFHAMNIHCSLRKYYISACLLMLVACVPSRAQPLGFAMEAFIPANLTAKIGDTVRIPVGVRRVSAVAQQLLIDSCRFTFRFNPTVLVPLRTQPFDTLYNANNLVESGITVRVNRRLRENDELIQIPMLVCLGDVDVTEISIDRGLQGYTFQIFASGMANGFTVQTVSNGLLRVENAVWNGILRTVNADNSPLAMTISPNPIVRDALIELSIGTLPLPPRLGLPSLVLYSTSGRDVPLVGLTDIIPMRFMGQSSVPIRFQRGTLPRGIYYARFTYGPYSITRLVVFE